MRAALLCLAAIHCGAPLEPPPHTPSTRLAIAPDQPLGWLGLVPSTVRRDTTPTFVPVAEHALVVPTGAPELPSTIRAIGRRGMVQTFTRASSASVPYGCDGNTLAVATFDGPPLEPGVAWLLPPAAPPDWRLAPLDIETAAATATRRAYTIGPLTLELARTAPLRGELTLSHRGRVVRTEPFERVLMEGADPDPIDLAAGGPAIPEPVAAWSIVGDAILLVVAIPGYEGVTLQPWLVQSSGARTVEAMEQYLYLCAF